MTAEIAVFNKSAVALAADSAVTVSGGGQHKIYNGAEKLFALTKHHPVGLMVYGSGDLCSAPWELVIKSYRRKLNSNSFALLEDYAEDFFNFLETSKNIVTPGMRDGHIYQFLSENVFGMLLEAFSNIKPDEYWNNFDPKQFVKDLEDYCQELLSKLSETDFLDGFSADDIDDAYNYASTVVVRIVSEKFPKVPTEEFPDSLLETVSHVFAAMICKQSDIGGISGIVIAGYGEDDFYPKVLSYDVCGFFRNKLRKMTNADKCSYDPDSGVTPFAQDEEVSAFMQGASTQLLRNLHNEYQSSIVNLLEGIDTVVQEMLPQEKIDAAQAAILQIVKGTVAECNEKISNYMRDNYISKVVNMIEFLPKQDLAYMAESLVNLTAFKRKVSDETETVGGPIDVAVISKADGFIWVKRKHYFDKELNHHYFSRS